jgi:putative addiction module killer protein
MAKVAAVDERRIRKRILRIENGNLGDYKSVGDGVFELRFFFGPGYRVYFAFDGETVVLLLSGGDKSSQNKDITSAQTIWQEIQHD